MAFKNTEWEYSNEVEASAPVVEEGQRYLMITKTQFDDSEKVYAISFKDLTNDAEFTLRYWLNTADKNTGAIIPNVASRGTLIALGKALAGEPIGIPNPDDIIGGVVCGEVILKPNADGSKVYPRIYKFEPVPEDVALLSTIDQFFIPEE